MKTLKEREIEVICDYLNKRIWSGNWHWYQIANDILKIIEDEEIREREFRYESDTCMGRLF